MTNSLLVNLCENDILSNSDLLGEFEVNSNQLHSECLVRNVFIIQENSPKITTRHEEKYKGERGEKMGVIKSRRDR